MSHLHRRPGADGHVAGTPTTGMTGLPGPRARLAAIAAAALLALTFAVATIAHGTAPAATAGLQSGPAPWAPEHASLASRLAALRLPTQSDTGFHIHVLLRIFIDGKPVPVPAQIGIDPRGRFLAPLHTHDASGIVHIESRRPYRFTLGQVFTVWGVRFTDTRIGGYADHGTRRLRVFVNGRHVPHPAARVLRAHDRIVVGYGPPGSFPAIDHTPFPPGL
jgi:hypothetical protein